MFAWLLAIIYAIWDHFAPYPTFRVEQVASSDGDENNRYGSDYIIVGGGTAGCVLAKPIERGSIGNCFAA